MLKVETEREREREREIVKRAPTSVFVFFTTSAKNSKTGGTRALKIEFGNVKIKQLKSFNVIQVDGTKTSGC